MRSSSDQYWIGLDHVRATAALLVFSWHFLHMNEKPLPLEGAPVVFPLALFDEGHTGVAVFMVLSGYLFAKILDGKDICYPKFFLNRFLRLVPLLVVAMILYGIQLWRDDGDISEYLQSIGSGLVLPDWPNGGWSITVEFHFYLLLPVALMLARRSAILLAGLLALAIAFRMAIFAYQETVQYLAYWTIIGRIDQFLLGILLFLKRDWLTGRGALVLVGFTAFCALAWLFDKAGGFYYFDGKYSTSSTSPWWILIPTFEGLAYATIIAWYDRNFMLSSTGISFFWAQYGKFSYSIYLLHGFVVANMATFVGTHIVPIDNIYTGIFFSLIAFLSMYPIGWFSYRFIESPFLKLRSSYSEPKVRFA